MGAPLNLPRGHLNAFNPLLRTTPAVQREILVLHERVAHIRALTLAAGAKRQPAMGEILGELNRWPTTVATNLPPLAFHIRSLGYCAQRPPSGGRVPTP